MGKNQVRSLGCTWITEIALSFGMEVSAVSLISGACDTSVKNCSMLPTQKKKNPQRTRPASGCYQQELEPTCCIYNYFILASDMFAAVSEETSKAINIYVNNLSS